MGKKGAKKGNKSNIFGKNDKNDTYLKGKEGKGWSLAWNRE